MRRIVIWLAATVTVVVLLFGYHTSTNSPAAASPAPSASAPATTPGTGGGSTSGASPDPTPSPSSSSPDPTPSPSSSSSRATPKTYTGDVADTRWGPVQVSITVTKQKITKVDVPEYPNGNPRDGEINARALPELVSETLSAQSAKIDMVSGATVTSDGYVQSLQSALDQAGI